MNKLLHERLRETANTCQFVRTKGFQCYLSEDLACELADEIEKYYDPKLRFEDGEPAKEGDKYIDSNGHKCIISGIDNRVRIWDENGECEYVDPRRPLIRPEHNALDADGIPCKKGDMVWVKGDVNRAKVEEVHKDRVWVKWNDGWTADVYIGDVSHREPDSLEKLRDDMADAVPFSGGGRGQAIVEQSKMISFVNRLTAIIERDA